MRKAYLETIWEFQERAPTRDTWPTILRSIFCFFTSQSYQKKNRKTQLFYNLQVDVQCYTIKVAGTLFSLVWPLLPIFNYELIVPIFSFRATATNFHLWGHCYPLSPVEPLLPIFTDRTSIKHFQAFLPIFSIGAIVTHFSCEATVTCFNLLDHSYKIPSSFTYLNNTEAVANSQDVTICHPRNRGDVVFLWI